MSSIGSLRGFHRAQRGIVWMVLVLVLVLATVIALLLTTVGDKEEAISWPGWGFTHTQVSADGGTKWAIESVQQALARHPMVQNQHIMGWGAENPEPTPGVYHFASLDHRINFIRETGGIPAITLCCAPDWMKGGNPGAPTGTGLLRHPSGNTTPTSPP